MLKDRWKVIVMNALVPIFEKPEERTCIVESAHSTGSSCYLEALTVFDSGSRVAGRNSSFCHMSLINEWKSKMDTRLALESDVHIHVGTSPTSLEPTYTQKVTGNWSHVEYPTMLRATSELRHVGFVVKSASLINSDEVSIDDAIALKLFNTDKIEDS